MQAGGGQAVHAGGGILGRITQVDAAGGDRVTWGLMALSCGKPAMNFSSPP